MKLIFFVFEGFSLVALLLAILFFIQQKGDKIANRLMGLLLVTFSFLILYSVLYWTNNIPLHINHTYYLGLSIIGPLFYLYIKRVFSKKKDGLHFLLHLAPLLLVFISLGWYYIQPISAKKNMMINSSFKEYNLLGNILDIVLLITLLLYAVQSLVFCKKAHKTNRDITLWGHYISISFLGIAISYLIYYILFFSGVLTNTQDYFISFTIVLFICFIGYMAFMQPELFNGKSISNVIPFVKYQKTGLSKAFSSELKTRVIHIITNEKIYLKNDIGLSDLANAIRVSRNQTSQVINEHFDMSFYDFINSYRILEARKIIDNDPNVSFKEIAYTVGFNNRTSFYKAFKKNTGFTPTQYKNNAHILENSIK